MLKKRSRRNWPRAAAAGLKAEAYKSIWGVEKDFVPARKAHLAFIVDDLAGMATKVKRAGYKVPADDPSKDATDVVSTIRSAIRSS
ncbi:MAG TPA: hypothetical protein VGJ76_02835 [Pseudolabrys sp.]